MNDHKNAKVVLENRELETGNRVGTLKSKDGIKQLYQNEDRGFVYYEDGKAYWLLEMISEKDHDKIIDGILEYLFGGKLEKTHTIEIQFEHYN